MENKTEISFENRSEPPPPKKKKSQEIKKENKRRGTQQCSDTNEFITTRQNLHTSANTPLTSILKDRQTDTLEETMENVSAYLRALRTSRWNSDSVHKITGKSLSFVSTSFSFRKPKIGKLSLSVPPSMSPILRSPPLNSLLTIFGGEFCREGQNIDKEGKGSSIVLSLLGSVAAHAWSTAVKNCFR